MMMKISLSTKAGYSYLVDVDEHLEWPSQPHCNYIKISKICSELNCATV